MNPQVGEVWGRADDPRTWMHIATADTLIGFYHFGSTHYRALSLKIWAKAVDEKRYTRIHSPAVSADDLREAAKCVRIVAGNIRAAGGFYRGMRATAAFAEANEKEADHYESLAARLEGKQ